MRFWILCVLFCASLSASEESRRAYLELIEERPGIVEDLGSYENGEIEIVLDPVKMAEIEMSTKRDVGVVYRDNYWVWVNDAVIFPSGSVGVYGRMFWAHAFERTSGASIFAIQDDGRVAILCNYRHATRSWELELPRGGIEVGEEPLLAAAREMKEETGMIVEKLQLLGEHVTDSGMAGTRARMYSAQIIKQEESEHEVSEAIEDVLLLTIPELKLALKRGYHKCSIRGKDIRVPCRDPFLAYALILYDK